MASTGNEIGASGLSMAGGGQITEEIHPNLTGRRALDTWRNMKDNDALVGAILFAIDMLIRQVDWRVDKKDSKDSDSQFLEEVMEDMSMSWGDFISECLSMLPFGFAFHEIVYKKRTGPQDEGSKTPSSRFSDGKVGWRKMPLRAQETLDRWDMDDQGAVVSFVQRAAPDYREVPIPISKGLLFRTTSYKNNPEGRSVLRSAYASWFYKKRIQSIEGTGIERDLAGFPVFWLPAEYLAPDADDDMKKVVAAFDKIGQNVRRDKQEYLLMPLAYDDQGNKAFDFTLTGSGGSRNFDTNTIIGRYNQEIAMSVLADFILLGHEKVGSFALSSDKTDLFATAIGTILDSIEDVLNRYAVPRLFSLNGMDQTKLPEIKHGDIETPDLSALGQYISSLTGAGVPLFPDEDLEAYLREAAGLPEKSEEAKKAQDDAKKLADSQAADQAKAAQDAAAAQTQGASSGSTSGGQVASVGPASGGGKSASNPTGADLTGL